MGRGEGGSGHESSLVGEWIGGDGGVGIAEDGFGGWWYWFGGIGVCVARNLTHILSDLAWRAFPRCSFFSIFFSLQLRAWCSFIPPLFFRIPMFASPATVDFRPSMSPWQTWIDALNCSICRLTPLMRWLWVNQCWSLLPGRW